MNERKNERKCKDRLKFEKNDTTVLVRLEDDLY